MSQSYSEDCNYGVITNGRSSKDALMTKSMVQEPRDSRSIEESLALIQHHVKVSQNDLMSSIKVYNFFLLMSMTISFKGLNDSTMYSGVPPPPASELPAVLPICPPPPGFSDSEHSLSDCDSLGSEPGQGQSSFQRFGFSRVSKPRSLAVPSLQEQLRMDRAVGQVSSNPF